MNGALTKITARFRFVCRQVQILSSEIITDTFKVYHEEESIFTPIKLADNNDALKTLIENAKQDAVANGSFEMKQRENDSQGIFCKCL